MLQAWRRQKVMTWAGYILGFPTDTPETIARDIEIIKRELPLDILEFFFLTPLPGSEDHKNLYLKGVPMDPDMNNYDLEHVCTAHPRMSDDEWRQVYRDAWARYYTDEHVETVLRRAVVSGIKPRKIADVMAVFSAASRIEGVHPLQCGVLRVKVQDPTSARNADRQSFAVLSHASGRIRNGGGEMAQPRAALPPIKKRVLADPSSKDYVDEATRPMLAEGLDNDDDFVAAFADKIPDTYGAPKRQPVAAAS